MLSSLKAFFAGYGTAIAIGGTSLDYHICASQTEANQADADMHSPRIGRLSEMPSERQCVPNRKE